MEPLATACDSELVGERPALRIVHGLGNDGVEAALSVPPRLIAQWRSLDVVVQHHLRTFFGVFARDAGEGVCVTHDGAFVPGDFAADLARGGPGFRAAFPRLVRRLASIQSLASTIIVGVDCEGTQDGTFFGLLVPKGRTVRFEEVHMLAIGSRGAVEDRLSLDVRAIVSQLGGRHVRGKERGSPADSPRGGLDIRLVGRE